MATLLQARTQVRNDINQPSASTSDFADSELNGIIDIAVRYLGALVKKPTKRYSIAAVYNTPTYAVATYAPDLIIPTVAYFGDPSIQGDVRKIRVIPEEELAEMRPNWLETTTSQLGRPEFVVKDGANLVISPTPSAAESAAGKTIFISGVYQPAALTSDSTSLDLPIVYHDLAIRLAVAYCYLDNKLNNPTAGQQKKNDVEADAKKLSNLIVKESESPGFYWGSAIDVSDDDFNGLRLF